MPPKPSPFIDDAFAAAVLFFATFAGGVAFGTFFHELGHLAAAWAVGWKPFGLTVGQGIKCVRFRVGRLDVELSAIPLGGLTQAMPLSSRHFKAKFFLYTAGGPLATIFLIALFWWLMVDPRWLRFPLLQNDIAPIVLISQVGILLEVLWPRQVRRPEGTFLADSLQMWRIARLKPEGVARSFIEYTYGYAGFCPVSSRVSGMILSPTAR